MITIPIRTKAPGSSIHHLRLNDLGKAKFQVSCVAGHYGDASEITVPVYSPTTTEAYAVYGEVLRS